MAAIGRSSKTPPAVSSTKIFVSPRFILEWNRFEGRKGKVEEEGLEREAESVAQLFFLFFSFLFFFFASHRGLTKRF